MPSARGRMAQQRATKSMNVGAIPQQDGACVRGQVPLTPLLSWRTWRDPLQRLRPMAGHIRGRVPTSCSDHQGQKRCPSRPSHPCVAESRSRYHHRQARHRARHAMRVSVAWGSLGCGCCFKRYVTPCPGGRLAWRLPLWLQYTALACHAHHACLARPISVPRARRRSFDASKLRRRTPRH
jgi:hypothetical protein